MEKIIKNILRIIIIVVFILNIVPIFSLASKEDLEKQYETTELNVDNFLKLLDKYDANNDNKLSQTELKKASDEEINKLAKMSDYATEFGPLQHKIYQDSATSIDAEYNDRRKEYGLDEDHDTNAGDSAESTGTIRKKYYAPEKDTSATSSGKSIDNVIEDAKDFISKAKDDVGTVEESSLQSFSNAFYNIFLTVGTAIAVIAGIIIGIKYMLGSVEEQADVKRMLVPYAVGCVVVFGSFGIWKIIIEILNNII